MYCELNGYCPICSTQLEFDSMTYDNKYEVHKCPECSAIAVMDSYTTPTESGLFEREGEVVPDIEGLFEYFLNTDDLSIKDLLKMLAIPSVTSSLLSKLKEYECVIPNT